MVDREFHDRSILIFATTSLKGIAEGEKEWIGEQVVQKIGYWKHISLSFSLLRNIRFVDIRI